MPNTEATLTTPRPDRYLTQLADHAAAMADGRGHRLRSHGRGYGNPIATGEVTLSVSRTAEHTVLRFDPWGTCTLRAADGQLALRVDAVDERGLQRIQQIVTRDLERFGRRDRLTLTWQRAGTVAEPPLAARAASRHRRAAPLVLAGTGVLAVALLVGLHLGLGGAVIAAGAWLGWTAVGATVLAAAVLVLGHTALPVAALRMYRRRGDERDDVGPPRQG